MATRDFNAPIWHSKKNQKYCDDATHEGNNLFKDFVFRYGEAVSLKIDRGQM